MIHNVTVTWDDEEYDEASTWEDFLKEYMLDEMHGFIDEMDLSEKTINRAHVVLDKVVKHLNRCIKTQPLNEDTVICCRDCKYFDPPHVEKDGERHEYNEFPQEAFDPFGIGVSVKYGTNVGGRCTYYNMCGYYDDKSVYVPDDNYCGRAERKEEKHEHH